MKYSLVISIISLCISPRITYSECIDITRLIQFKVHKYSLKYVFCFVAWVLMNTLEEFGAELIIFGDLQVFFIHSNIVMTDIRLITMCIIIKKKKKGEKGLEQ